MKLIHFTVPAPRPRRHQVLFDQNLPFRARVEHARTKYQRRPKHPQRDQG